MQQEVVKATKIRKVTAKRLTQSWAQPRVTYTNAIDTAPIKKFRAELNAKLDASKPKVSYNTIYMKACAIALMENPDVNAYFDGENVTYNKQVNIGLAVNTDRGLFVPNVKNCDAKSIHEITEETDKLANLTKAGKLMLDDMMGGTFTVTNLGAFGIDHATPIINMPEMAILGIYAMKDTPVAENGQVVIKNMQNLVLVANHCLVDGVLAAKFFNRVIEILNNPSEYIK